MDQWEDEGIVIGLRPYGERDAIATLLTRERGRHAGFVRNAQRKTVREALQLGRHIFARWRGRLDNHLGTFQLELQPEGTAHLSGIYAYQKRLLGLKGLCDTAALCLPERNALPPVYNGMRAMLGILMQPTWLPALVIWELQLLQSLGYGLELDRCAATGAADGLAYVSPKTGRAISSAAGEAHADKLFTLPPFLRGDLAADPDDEALHAGLRLTRYFLTKHVLHPLGQQAPFARVELERLMMPSDHAAEVVAA